MVLKLPGLDAGGNTGANKGFTPQQMADIAKVQQQKAQANTAPKTPTPGATNTNTGVQAPTPQALPTAPTAQAMPTAPTFSPFTYNYDYLNYDTAKQRAEDRYNPLFQQAVQGVKDQQYQNELNSGQSAAVRGLGHSGLAQDALTKIAIASQGQIAGLNAQKMTNVADYAQNLLDKDQSRGDALRGQMFNEYNANRNFDYGQYRDNVGDVRYNNETAYNHYRDNVGDIKDANNTAYNHYRDNVGDNQWQQQFDHTKSQDALQQSNWQTQFNYNKGQDSQQQSNWQQNFDYQKAIDQRNWSHMSPAEREKAAMDLANSMKLKKASGGSNGNNPYAPGVIANNPGQLPINMDEFIKMIMSGGYSKTSNYGRQNGTMPVIPNSGPESKKAHPLYY